MGEIKLLMKESGFDGMGFGNTIILMRTTILLDDELGERLRAEARKAGKSFSAFLADAGRQALGSPVKSEEKEEPFQLVTFRGEGTLEGVQLDRTSELLAAEDIKVYGSPQS